MFYLKNKSCHSDITVSSKQNNILIAKSGHINLPPFWSLWRLWPYSVDHFLFWKFSCLLGCYCLLFLLPPWSFFLIFLHYHLFSLYSFYIIFSLLLFLRPWFVQLYTFFLGMYISVALLRYRHTFYRIYYLNIL